jgi:16S rRNA (guanine966-N2)-methyltransferase
MPQKNPNTLRIIGGTWRGRKLHFPDVDGLRPTPDRVRETLFNWLQPIITGAHCLDLFAGSGALGFEALSRGAASVVMIERDGTVVKQLRENIALLKTTNAQVLQRDALEFLNSGRGDAMPFDVVFLDPPYQQNLIEPCCAALERHGWLAAHAHLYIETERSLTPLRLPASFTVMRDKAAGQVAYRLIACTSPSPLPPT